MFGEDQCPIHHCKLEEYGGMTDCGYEWDVRCPQCYEERMWDDIAMAEDYGRRLRLVGSSPLNMIVDRWSIHF